MTTHSPSGAEDFDLAAARELHRASQRLSQASLALLIEVADDRNLDLPLQRLREALAAVQDSIAGVGPADVL